MLIDVTTPQYHPHRVEETIRSIPFFTTIVPFLPCFQVS